MTSIRARQLASLRPDAGALLIVDVQRSFADPALIESAELDGAAASAVASAVVRCADLVEAARAQGTPVYWIELATPKHEPWGASMWLRRGDADALPDSDEPCVIGTPGAEWYGVEPSANEVRIAKRRYSGFVGTGLADRLTADGVEWVSVAGLTTECCVAATVMDAFQLGWPVLLAEDATAAYAADIHAAAVAALGLNAALISSVAEISDVWSRRVSRGAEAVA